MSAGLRFNKSRSARRKSSPEGGNGRPVGRAAQALLAAAALIATVLLVASFALSGVIKLNLTASMPIGLYILRPASATHRGEVVIACPPPEAQRIGVANGYLAPARGLMPGSRCSSGSAPLLKYALAFAGDVIEISENGLFLNGRLIDAQTPARLDRRGRKLASVPFGRYRMAIGQVWLYSPARYSWDSRYFGPARLSDVLGTAAPLWTTSPVAPAPTWDRRNKPEP